MIDEEIASRSSTDQLDDFEQLALERNSCFAISYLLLKHFLLSVMFLMAIFTMVRLTMTDSHVKHVIQSDPSDISQVSSDTSNVRLSINSNVTSTADQLVGNSTNSDSNDYKGEFFRVKSTVIMARISAILAIVFGILGIFTESVTLLLFFVLHTSFRLVTTLYIPAFHYGLVSMIILLIINVLSFTYVTLLIIRSWNICRSNHQPTDDIDPLASKLESAIEIKLTIPEDEDITAEAKDKIINALNRRVSKVPSISTISSFKTANKMRSNSVVSIGSYDLQSFYLRPPTRYLNRPTSSAGSTFGNSSCRTSQCLPPSIADAIAKSLASTSKPSTVVGE